MMRYFNDFDNINDTVSHIRSDIIPIISYLYEDTLTFFDVILFYIILFLLQVNPIRSFIIIIHFFYILYLIINL